MPASVEIRNIYDCVVEDHQNNTINLSNFKGKVCLIINIASKDENAEKMFKHIKLLNAEFHNKGLETLLFPCFQFGPKETLQDVLPFATENGLSTSHLFQAVEVNGSKSPELYKYLKQKRLAHLTGFIKGNFTVFIIDRTGEPVVRINPGHDFDVLRNKIEEYILKQM